MSEPLSPDTGEVLRTFLGSVTNVTALVSTRIATSLTGPQPAIRYVLLLSGVVGGGAVWARYQVECWGAGGGAPDDGTSDLLARRVIAAIPDMVGTIAGAQVAGASVLTMLRNDDDTSKRPRNIVEVAFTAHP